LRLGTYGVCEMTARPISAARLQAIPWARYAEDVEAELERSGRFPRPRLGELRRVTSTTPVIAGGVASNEEEASPVPNDEKLFRTPPLPGSGGESRETARRTSHTKRGR